MGGKGWYFHCNYEVIKGDEIQMTNNFTMDRRGVEKRGRKRHTLFLFVTLSSILMGDQTHTTEIGNFVGEGLTWAGDKHKIFGH